MATFSEFISTLGYSLAGDSASPKPADFQRLVEKIRGKPEEKPIAFLLLRTMQKARYDPANVGHFGLAADAYTHFTSPIRRYRTWSSIGCFESRGRASATSGATNLAADLPEMGRHTSERERRANDAERELVQWKKVRFMADKVGDEFEGYVTGVSAYGLYIELVEHFVEGMVHVSTMADDYYRFMESAHVLRGEKNGRVYRLGDRLKVQVIRVDLERRQIDLGVSEILEAVRVSERGRGPRRSQARPKERSGNVHARERTGRPGRRERAGKKAPRRRRQITSPVRACCRPWSRP